MTYSFNHMRSQLSTEHQEKYFRYKHETFLLLNETSVCKQGKVQKYYCFGKYMNIFLYIYIYIHIYKYINI